MATEPIARRRPRRATLKDEAAQHLRGLIFSGELPPTSRINQDAIAEHLGISKLPVREALIQLASEGLVDMEANRGAFVAPLGPDDVRDHYHIFGLVAGLAVERATPLLEESEIEELVELQREMDAATDSVDQERLNHEFHRRLHRVGASRRLLAVLRYLSGTMPLDWFSFAEGWSEVACRQHWGIIEALRDRDAELAGARVVEHFTSVANQGVEILRDRGAWSPAD